MPYGGVKDSGLGREGPRYTIEEMTEPDCCHQSSINRSHCLTQRTSMSPACGTCRYEASRLPLLCTMRRRLPHLGAGHFRVEGASPGRTPRTRSRADLGWLDVGQDDAAALSSAWRSSGRRRKTRPSRGGAAARHGRQQPLRRGASLGVTASRRATPSSTCSTRPTSAPSATRPRRMAPERTWFVVASKSGGTVEVASMERFFWSRMAAALGSRRGPAVHCHHRPGHRAREACAAHAVIRGTSSSIRRTSADASPRCRCLGWCRRRCIGASACAISSLPARQWPKAAARRTTRTPGSSSARSSAPATLAGRDKLTVVARRRRCRSLGSVDRAARGREYRQTRQGRAAGRR